MFYIFPLLVFELLEGGEILEIPTDSPLEEKDIWESFRGIILGLEYCKSMELFLLREGGRWNPCRISSVISSLVHYQKIIHRDLKPSNLLRTVDGLVKIADLGVSNEFDGHDALLTNTAGTPAFTSPESLAQRSGKEPYSGKVRGLLQTSMCLLIM